MRTAARITVYVIAALALIGIGTAIGSTSAGSSGASAGSSPAPAATVTVPGAAPTVTATVTAKPAVPDKSTMSGDGVFVIGQDITPGTYHTTGAVNGSDGNCYYALLSSTNTSDIIDNNNVTGPATITVGPGVKAVDISGCEMWSRV
jgi:hypothetical protein